MNLITEFLKNVISGTDITGVTLDSCVAKVLMLEEEIQTNQNNEKNKEYFYTLLLCMKLYDTTKNTEVRVILRSIVNELITYSDKIKNPCEFQEDLIKFINKTFKIDTLLEKLKLSLK